MELNPVRAKLVEAPEQWEHGSSFCRSQGLDDWLMPLEEALPGLDSDSVKTDYRSRLYHRGAVAEEEGQGIIPRPAVRF